MKYIVLTIIALALLLHACMDASQQIPELNTKEDIIQYSNKLRENTSVYLLSSEVIKGTDFLMFPLGAGVYEKGGSYRSDYRETKVWNILFYNKITNESHLLVDTAVIIINNYTSEAELEYLNEIEVVHHVEKKRKQGQLFYEIRMLDFNNDGIIDYKDPNGLFFSDLTGNNLKRISPEEMNLTSWKFIDSSKTYIELRGQIDTNKNRRFEDGDAEKVYVLTMDSTINMQDVLPDELKAKLTEMVVEQSIPKKK